MNEISYTITKKDCVDYARFIMKMPRFMFQTLKRIFFTALTIMLVIIILSVHNLSGEDIKFIFIFFIYLFVIFLILSLISQYFFLGGRTYKQFKKVNLNYTLKITDEYLNCVSETGTFNLNWSSIKEIYEDKTLFLIFVSEFNAVIVPKRVFEREAQAKDFYTLIQEHFSSAKTVK